MAVPVFVSACAYSERHADGEQSIPEYGLEPIVQIGAVSDAAPEYLFSQVNSLDVDPSTGEVYVSDSDAVEIRVFSRDGAFLRTIGGPGDGPAEFDFPPAFAVWNDTLVAVDRTGLHVFSADGDHVRTGRYGVDPRVDVPWAIDAGPAGWQILAPVPMRTLSAPRVQELYELDLAEMQLSGPIDQVENASGQGIFPRWRQIVLAGDDHVTSDGIGYRLIRHQRGSAPDTLSFGFDPVATTTADFAVYDSVQWAQCAELGEDRQSWCQEWIPDHVKQMKSRGLPDYRPVIGVVRGSAEGDLLVARNDLDPEPFDLRSERPWDIVRADEIVGRVTTPDRFRALWFGADELWGQITDEFDVPYVVGYRLISP